MSKPEKQNPIKNQNKAYNTAFGPTTRYYKEEMRLFEIKFKNTFSNTKQ